MYDIEILNNSVFKFENKLLQLKGLYLNKINFAKIEYDDNGHRNTIPLEFEVSKISDNEYKIKLLTLISYLVDVNNENKFKIEFDPVINKFIAYN